MLNSAPLLLHWTAEAGADVYCRDAADWSCLKIARCADDKDLIAALLQHQEDVEVAGNLKKAADKKAAAKKAAAKKAAADKANAESDEEAEPTAEVCWGAGGRDLAFHWQGAAHGEPRGCQASALLKSRMGWRRVVMQVHSA